MSDAEQQKREQLTLSPDDAKKNDSDPSQNTPLSISQREPNSNNAPPDQLLLVSSSSKSK